ncbi:DUF397 domain-containing protein [Saccharothrix violaceirubra]|uniref:DUF397 domain-containing protein n=1 Tax=Saccharothrix violaceirubra TaxID=413306 RepID=A0A7W7WTX6_9PSEU|nr:DUF397 domain-containing protein [Saccharothrix violaceirubra]MBB4963604.1 hypothetical protein [Saccharothrix violaceirubra]
MKYEDLSGAAWRTSSYSGNGEACVEVAPVDDRVAARDSKNPTGPVLTFTADQWRTFCTSLTGADRP